MTATATAAAKKPRDQNAFSSFWASSTQYCKLFIYFFTFFPMLVVAFFSTGCSFFSNFYLQFFFCSLSYCLLSSKWKSMQIVNWTILFHCLGPKNAPKKYISLFVCLFVPIVYGSLSVICSVQKFISFLLLLLLFLLCSTMKLLFSIAVGNIG